MELEGEALLLGLWKNIEDLEDSITLAELELLVKASREKEHRIMKFYAAFKGVDLDEGVKSEQKERFEAAQRRAEARIRGASEDEVAEASGGSFADFGLEVETD